MQRIADIMLAHRDVIAMKRNWNAAVVGLSLVRLGQELGTDSPAARALHDLLDLFLMVPSALFR